MDMKESGRVKRLPPYLFSKTNALKAQYRAKGIDVIDFGMGNPDKPTPEHIVKKLVEAVQDPKTHRYSTSKGIPHLRQAIAKWYENRFGVSINPETEAVAVIGSKEGIAHLAFALLDEGDVVLVPNPTYPIHSFSVMLAGGNLVTFPVTKETNFVPNLADIFQHTWPKPKMLILSYPHNPTTATVDLNFFEEVVDFARKHDLIVIHDLAYADITFDGYKAPSFMQARGALEVGAEFITLSKSYNMAGWRVGFLVGNAQIVGALTKLKSYLDYGIFTPVQVAAIAALGGQQECVQEAAQIYQRRRDLMVEGLCKIGWNVEKPKATMYLWAPLPERFKTMGSMEFTLMLLEKAGVAVSPGIGFGQYGEGYVRIALVENRERIKQALKNIKKVLIS